MSNQDSRQFGERLPEILLNRLHTPTGGERSRNLIVFTEEIRRVREGVARILTHLFRGYEIRGFEKTNEALRLVSGDARKQIALAMFDMDGSLSGKKLDDDTAMLQVFRGTDAGALKTVPLFMTLRDDPGSLDLGRLQERGIDEILEKPTDIARFIRSLTQGISSRLGETQEMEREAKVEVIAKFCTRYKSLLGVWAENIQNLSFYPRDEEDLAQGDTNLAVIDIFEGIRRISEYLETLRGKGAEMDKKSLGKLFHDIKNPLSYVIVNLDYLLKHKLGKEDLSVLRVLQSEVKDFSAQIKAMADANAERNGLTWLQALDGMRIEHVDQALEIPEGMIFCVIDDDERVISACTRAIVKAGGRVVSVRNADELEGLVAFQEFRNVNVVLLDHNLGSVATGLVYGHQLLPILRANVSPTTRVILHTSEIESVGADPKYRKCHGAIAKLAFRDLSRMLEELNNAK